MTDYADNWERFLDPDVLRQSLFLATMFTTAFEILKNSIVDRVRDFYADGFDKNGPSVGAEGVVAQIPVMAEVGWGDE